MTEFLLSRKNTEWIQGFSALMIMLMHFIMQTESYPRIINILGSIGVAAFLFVSGFGINESHKNNGLHGFWRKRITRVALPYWTVLLFQLPFLPYTFDPSRLLHNLLFIDSDLWFIDCIMRWYLVYWIGRKFMPRHTLEVLAAYAIANIFMQQFFSEQAFSFLCGYIVSAHYDKIKKIKKRYILAVTIACCIYGCALTLLKELPQIQQAKGTLPFNILLLNIKLPLATSIIAMPYLIPAVKKWNIINWFGKISYELYIVHYNFMPYITSMTSILTYSGISIAISAVFNHINTIIRTKEHFIQGTAALIFIGIGYIFACKYSMRITDHYAYPCLAYAILAAIFTTAVINTNKKNNRWLQNPTIFYASAITLAIAMIAVQYHLDPLQNNVDRWSAIENPLKNLFQGDFPYMAETHLGGNASPFPVWMVFHIPFYLLGNVGLSEIFTCMAFVWSIKVLRGYEAATKAVVLLTMCLPVWYEVAVRSDLISNFFLLATFVNLLLARGITFEQKPMALSIACGLWLSTRLSVAFPLFIMFLTDFLKLPTATKLKSAAIIIVTFALTFVPLAIWDADYLFGATNNPFSLQFRQGHTQDTMMLLAVATAMAFTWKACYKRLLLYMAAILALIPIVAYTHSMYIYDNWTGIFDTIYDITYLDAALPFCITILATATSTATSVGTQRTIAS